MVEVGFINWSKKKKRSCGSSNIKCFNAFFGELSSQFTTYSLSVAMSQKSKWSQRMYELCQSGKEQMVLEYPLKIYENFCFRK
jgi:plasmid replication initiation protein